jgi:hypothetical protein
LTITNFHCKEIFHSFSVIIQKSYDAILFIDDEEKENKHRKKNPGKIIHKNIPLGFISNQWSWENYLLYHIKFLLWMIFHKNNEVFVIVFFFSKWKFFMKVIWFSLLSQQKFVLFLSFITDEVGWIINQDHKEDLFIKMDFCHLKRTGKSGGITTFSNETIWEHKQRFIKKCVAYPKEDFLFTLDNRQ